MRVIFLASAVVGLGGIGWLAASSLSDPDPVLQPAETTPPARPLAVVDVVVPDLQPAEMLGKTAYDAKCASCHAPNAAGQDGVAPPLVHKIYEPSHHGDAAFHLAVQNGVRAHHWRYGNMPPVAGLTTAEVDSIIAYIRALQRANGIF